MVRTQIYLTENEQRSLRVLSRRTGYIQSQLIREAVDRYIASADKPERLAALRQARGLWAGREDLPDFAALRRKLDRSNGQSG